MKPALRLSLVLAAGVAAVLAAGAPENARILRVQDVQQTIGASGSSPRVGDRVTVEGVVTGVGADGRFYYVADSAGGEFSGLKVEGPALARTRGEIVVVSGRVAEWYGETRLVQTGARSFGPGALPDPVVVTVADLVSAGEPFEGVLVTVRDVTVVEETSRYGEFPIRDASGEGALVDDEFFHSYIADPGDSFASITGLLSYGFGDFLVEPRDDGDLEGFVSGRGFDGEISFWVFDEAGRPLPSKATLFPVAGGRLVLGPDDRAEGSEDVVYLGAGVRTVRVPSGEYDVVVSRGIEYGLHEERVTVPAGGAVQLTATLPIEVETPGWISGDFHLHSTPSFDTPLPVPGRLESLAAEGVEWAVATDHNAVTDYAPVIERLGLGSWITSSIGDEITTSSPRFGHFNAWPLEPGSPPRPFSGLTPASLFAKAREDPGVEVVQVNHPVIAGSDQYFQVYDVDPFTGVPGEPGFSFDFDALEVMNGKYVNEGLANLDTWMAMWNDGHRITATGNSDSHHLVFSEPGYPRNYVAASTDAPDLASEDALVDAVRAGRVFVTYGPILDFEANGAAVGDLVSSTPGGEVHFDVRVQWASWMSPTVGRLYGNGRVVASFDLGGAPGGAPGDVRIAWTESPSSDTWYVFLVDGEGDLAPVRRGSTFRPLAFTNPIRVDADRDGEFTAPGNYSVTTPIATIDAVDANGISVEQGEWFVIGGCATTDTRFLDGSTGIFYLDDGTGGVQVRESPGTVTEIRRGDRVVLGGFVSQVLGETVLGDAVVESVTDGTSCPGPVEWTTGGLAAGAEPAEGRVVRIRGANVTSGSFPSDGREGALEVDDGSGPAMLWVPSGVVVSPDANDLVDFAFTALVTQRDFSPPYDSGYRLTLRSGADLATPGSPTSVGIARETLALGSPRPNPFAESLRIPVRGRPREGDAFVEIHDVSGRRVRSLAVDEGAHSIVWDGRDARGRSVGSGVYLVRLRTAERVAGTERVVKLR